MHNASVYYRYPVVFAAKKLANTVTTECGRRRLLLFFTFSRTRACSAVRARDTAARRGGEIETIPKSIHGENAF